MPLIAYYLGGKANGSNAQPLYKPEYKNLAPHVGFAWNPGFDKKSVLNGGAGIVYDRTIINSFSTFRTGILTFSSRPSRLVKELPETRMIRSKAIRGLPRAMAYCL